MRAQPPQRGEEGAEEHHFREDEPAHAPAERQLDLVAVVAVLTLADGLAEPLKQDSEQPEQTEEQRVLAPSGAVDPLGGAQDDPEQAERRHDWMARGLWHEIVRRGARCS